MNYEQMAQTFKVLSDKNRVEILDLLSCGPLCACEILEHFDVTQPTLSHHMKQLVSVGLVKSWKEGKNTMYQLNDDEIKAWLQAHQQIFNADERCICHSVANCCGETA